ncbi:MAG: LysM peptidoglycan-binding domain-containing protein, partial [Saprospiraceae bacterium]
VKCKKKSSKDLHIVQSGETLYQLSQKYDVRVAQLQAWNGLGSSTYLAPCTELAITQPASYVVNQSPRLTQQPKTEQQTEVITKPRVPIIVAPQAAESRTPVVAQAQPRTPVVAQTQPATPTVQTKIICQQSSSPGVHIVQQGETLVQIAAIHKVTAGSLRSWNNLSANDLIQACQALNTRPTNTATSTESNIVMTPAESTADQLAAKTAATRRIIHVVKEGESLGSIAAMYNMTVVQVLSFNQLPNNTLIFVGQQLYVIAPSQDVPTSFNNSAQRINSTGNNVTTTTNSTVVPAEVFSSRGPEPATFDTTVSRNGEKRVHVVQDGETIESIAKLYGVSPSRIRSVNLLDERDVVIPLQKIYISN